MSQAKIAPTTETKVKTSSTISFYCYVTLSESEQIIVTKEVSDGNWINGVYVASGTKITEKYRLEALIYAGHGEPSQFNTGVYLDRIIVRGFTKEGALRYRDTTFYCNSPALSQVIPQIPDNYHDYARKAFAERAIKLQEQLSNLTNQGVKIGN